MFSNGLLVKIMKSNSSKLPSLNNELFNDMEKFKIENSDSIIGGLALPGHGHTSAGLTVYSNNAPSTKDSEATNND